MESLKLAQIIGLVIVLGLAIFSGVMIALKSKKHTLAKVILLFILTALGFTWVFGYGYYNGSSYLHYGMYQEGLSDLANYLYYAINFAGDKVIFILALGAFYAVLTRSKGYKKLVNSLSENLKGKEIIFVLMCSLLITVMTSIFTQNLIVLVFVPFIISVLLSLKLDKITAFCATFGSMLIGILGQTYGGEGLYWFNIYTSIDLKTGIVYRLLILLVAFVLFNFFTVIHAKKVLKDKNDNAIESDLFKVEKLSKDEEKAHVWPTILMFVILLVIIILGYTDWEANFGITIFKEFHEKLLTFTLSDIPLIGNLFSESLGEMTPFKAILGTVFKLASETNDGVPVGYLGAWNLLHASMVLIIISVFSALINRVKLDDFIESYIEGFKKIILPLGAVLGAYAIMTAAYISPFIPRVINLIFDGITKFNPFLVTLGAIISNIFHADFGLTGYLVANFFTVTYAQNIEVVHLIFTSIYGLISLLVPSSIVLVLGLTYLKIDYKEWLKYIWMFALGMLVILLILFTVLTYI